MPLPAALQARLAKRGIVKKEDRKKPVEEEVFAEDYDEPMKALMLSEEGPLQNVMPHRVSNEEEKFVREVSACPNKTNPYHTCVSFCEERWGLKLFEGEESMIKKRNRVLTKYPLPENWKEVADPETGRYYYWNTQSDEVSWLPPNHPRANITLPAERLQELLSATGGMDVTMTKTNISNGDQEEEMEEDFETIEKEVLKEKKPPKRERKGRSKGTDDLDPMDPASYSDISRGTWSSGLDLRGSAKTGVDVTATGPLFQQRPYPSPGDILRANKQMSDGDD